MKPTLTILVFALFALGAGNTSAQSDSIERAKNKNFGERFIFLGWSPDNLHVAYTLDRVKRPIGPKKPPRVRIRHIMRRVYKGHLGSLSSIHGKRLKRHVKSRGYVIKPLAVESIKKNLWRIDTPKTTVYLKVEAKKMLTWTLFSSDGNLATGTLDQPYIRFEPQAYLSPNEKMLILGMQVNTGWYENAVVQTANIETLQ